jgi:UDP-N-acetylmuramate dehydrogenase
LLQVTFATLFLVMNLQTEQSLNTYQTFGLDITAKEFTEISNVSDLKDVVNYSKSHNKKLLILGGGSNILFTQDFDGLVIKNSLKGIEKIKETEHHVWVKAAAGEVWHQLVLYAVNNNWGGIENMSLIPGCCGAAPMQNIGAYGVELKDVFESLEAYKIEEQHIYTFTNEECKFGYRESVFKHEAKGKYIITSITLRLTKTWHQFKTDYGDIKHTLEEMQVNDLTVKEISDAVIKIRQSKLPDPKVLGNAGSFFKNPEIDTELYNKLKNKYPLMPGYPSPHLGKTKIAAGWLIEQCGWKGKKVGPCGSHEKQALVLVNYGGATGNDILQLAKDIIASVYQTFEISLQPEVNII